MSPVKGQPRGAPDPLVVERNERVDQLLATYPSMTKREAFAAVGKELDIPPNTVQASWYRHQQKQNGGGPEDHEDIQEQVAEALEREMEGDDDAATEWEAIDTNASVAELLREAIAHLHRVQRLLG